MFRLYYNTLKSWQYYKYYNILSSKEALKYTSFCVGFFGTLGQNGPILEYPLSNAFGSSICGFVTYCGGYVLSEIFPPPLRLCTTILGSASCISYAANGFKQLKCKRGIVYNIPFDMVENVS